jgi:hypothetical protein
MAHATHAKTMKAVIYQGIFIWGIGQIPALSVTVCRAFQGDGGRAAIANPQTPG